jgi:hypothetical protein
MPEVASAQRPGHGFEFGIRRIEQGEIETLACRCEAPHDARGVAAHDLRPFEHPQIPRLARNTSATAAERSTNTACVASRDSASMPSAGAREQIECGAHAIEVAEAREERLPHAVGRGPHHG